MRCFGRTANYGKRCQNQCKFIFCSHHIWQWLGVLAFIGVIAGIYADMIQPMYSWAKSHLVEEKEDLIVDNDFNSIFNANDADFKVLILRFEDYIADKNTNCIGRAIQENLNIFKSNNPEVQIEIKYVADSIKPPVDENEAIEIRKKHHADLIIYGKATNLKIDCNGADICFRYDFEPLIGTRLLPLIDVKSKRFDSEYISVTPFEIENNMLSIDALALNVWVKALIDLKYGNENDSSIMLDKIVSDTTISLSVRSKRLLEMGNTFQKGGGLSKAVYAYNEAMKDTLIESSARFMRAVVYGSMGLNDSVLKEVKKLLRQNANEPKYYAIRALAYMNLGKKDSALIDVEKAIQLDPLFSNYYLLQGNIYSSMTDFENGIKSFMKASKTGTNKKDKEFNNLAAMYSNIGSFKKALDYANIAISINPNNSAYYQTRGDIYKKTGKYFLAISDYDTTIEKDTDNIEPYKKCANIFGAYLGDCKQAIAEMKKAMSLASQSELSMLYFQRSIFSGYCFGKGKTITDLKKAIEIDPKNTLAIAQIGFTYLDAGMYELAEKEMKKGLELDPWDIEMLSLKAHLLIRRKKPKEAFKIIKYLKSRKDQNLHCWTFVCYYALVEDHANTHKWLITSMDNNLPARIMLSESILSEFRKTKYFNNLINIPRVQQQLKSAKNHQKIMY